MEYVEKTCDYPEKDQLNLVYIGSFNQFRGVIETAEYVEQFNDKYAGQYSLAFDVFCANFSLIERLSEEGKINHKGSIKYAPLMEKIAEYDVGICLLLPIKKYTRNISMKNFEYMSVGLPVLTSNFGQCKKYVNESGAGLCIDPKSYPEFEDAILKLFDKNLREEFGEAGQRYCKEIGSFEKEAQPYVEQMKDFSA
jgi:glycosyltransferase involved in cell wall biosynthesis